MVVNMASIFHGDMNGKMESKVKEILEKYGRLAIVIYLSTFVLTFTGVFCLIQMGMKDSVVDFFESYLGEGNGAAGTIALAYAITKITQPLRIALTVLLIPIFGRVQNGE